MIIEKDDLCKSFQDLKKPKYLVKKTSKLYEVVNSLRKKLELESNPNNTMTVFLKDRIPNQG